MQREIESEENDWLEDHGNDVTTQNVPVEEINDVGNTCTNKAVRWFSVDDISAPTKSFQLYGCVVNFGQVD